MSELQEFASRDEAELQAAFPPDPNSPTRTALRKAFRDCFLMLISAVDGSPSSQLTPQNVLQVFKELKALTGWVCDATSKDDWKRLRTLTADKLSKDDWTYSAITDLLKAANIGKRGHPVTDARDLAIKAYDLRLKSPPTSWPKITKQLCRCGQHEHTLKCQERIRIAALELGKLLKGWGIVVVH